MHKSKRSLREIHRKIGKIEIPMHKSQRQRQKYIEKCIGKIENKKSLCTKVVLYYFSFMLFFPNRITAITRTIGKMHPTPIPAFILSPVIWLMRPTSPGPIAPPKSPAMARSANISVPPAGNLFEEMEMVPGHIMPTEKPQNIHPSNPSSGSDEREVRR